MHALLMRAFARVLHHPLPSCFTRRSALARLGARGYPAGGDDDAARLITTMLNRATHLQLKGDVRHAEAVAREALAAIDARPSPSQQPGDDALAIDCVTFLGKLVQLRGDPRGAGDLFRRAWRAQAAARGEGHVDTLAARGRLAYSLHQRHSADGDDGDDEAADANAERGAAAAEAHYRAVLDGLEAAPSGWADGRVNHTAANLSVRL